MHKSSHRPLPEALQDKTTRLRELMESAESLLIAFSGGVDSTFLVRIAHDVLGDKAVAVTARSNIYPAFEYADAVAITQRIGIRHLTLDTHELDTAAFRNNPTNRCYHCKKNLFGRLIDMARDLNLARVADGSNADDANDIRPGMRATRELGVMSPLKEAGWRKDDIRMASRCLGLPTWNKPSCACLASRFPYGQPITEKGLAQIAQAEASLRDLGFGQVRVRHHGPTARIEILATAIPHLMNEALRRQVVSRLKSLGYTYVTLDLEGYRTGSMNEVIAGEQRDVPPLDGNAS